MLPVDLLDTLDRVARQRVVDGDSGHGSPAQVRDHVIYRAQLLLKVVVVPRAALRLLGAVILRLFSDQTEIIKRLGYVRIFMLLIIVM